MYLKGRIKIGVNSKINSGNEFYEIRSYVDSLNQKYQRAKNDLTAIFYLKNDGEYRNNNEESFDSIINSIMSGEEKPQNEKKDKKFELVFHVNYYVKTNRKDISESEIKGRIENFVKSARNPKLRIDNVHIIKHTINVQKSIDVFDELVYNNPNALKSFYGGLLNEKDISVLSETYATCKMVQKDIANIKYNEETLLNKYSNTCKDDKILNEIHRIFNVTDNKNIQGVNYYFNEENYDIRQDIYKVLASALYSNGRLNNPYYYVVEIDVNDRNTKSNVLYLKTRLKISRNDLYFFEFSKKSDQSNSMFDSSFSSFSDEKNQFFKALRENQFINIFGIYADDEAKQHCTDLEEKELIEKLSFVVFSDKLNKDAQILYAKEKLKKLDQLDLFPAMVDIIEYQNTQVDGLSTSELEDYILTVLKSKYEKVYRPIYEHVTKDMSNGNMTKKLMNMVGFNNLKQAVAELCNKINFKNIKEELLPATKVLNQMSSYERNNWILTGVPGTGKSTGAEILEKVMYQEKIIKKDLIVKYTPSKADDECIITPFGPMSTRTSSDLHDSFSQSMGGVLIIDEIGHLTKEDKSLLLQLMEDYKRDVCVILCGYENEAKDLLNFNPGFRSRFTHIVKMEEYTVDELLMILEQKLNDKHFSLSEDAKVSLKTIITDVRQIPNFGQARFMESMSDKLIGVHSSNKLKQIENLVKENNDTVLSDKDIYEIIKEDVDLLPLDDMLGDDYALAKKHKDAYSELNNLIGCTQVKKAVSEFVAKSKIDRLKVERKLIDKTALNMNMVFYGSPGTAKTTVARLVAKLMYDKGLISKPKIKEVGAADLVAAYVGQTAIKTTMVFEEAKGGVLFIDEAYALANDAGGFNQEAIDTIIKEMENRRNDTMVIFAGYKDKMEEFIRMNPGFKSRISKYVDFPNYSIDELIQIFNKLCKDKGYTLKENDKDMIEEQISKYIEKIKDDKQFGNGRECRTILENAVNAQSKRLMEINDISDEDLMTLKGEDFEFLNESLEFGKEKKSQIGFKV